MCLLVIEYIQIDTYSLSIIVKKYIVENISQCLYISEEIYNK